MVSEQKKISLDEPEADLGFRKDFLAPPAQGWKGE